MVTEAKAENLQKIWDYRNDLFEQWSSGLVKSEQFLKHTTFLNLLLHYSRFGVFLSKIGMHVKTVQIELFAIEIIISIHISSLKKVLPKCENWQKKFLIFYLLKVSFPGHFFDP